MQTSDGSPQSRAPFIGHIQKFLFNNIPYLSNAYQGQILSNVMTSLKFSNPASFVIHFIPMIAGDTREVTYTCVFSSERLDPIGPVSFGATETYVTLDDTPSNSITTVYMRLRTGEKNGLILYREGRNGDYVALELIQVRVVSHTTATNIETKVASKK